MWQQFKSGNRLDGEEEIPQIWVWNKAKLPAAARSARIKWKDFAVMEASREEVGSSLSVSNSGPQDGLDSYAKNESHQTGGSTLPSSPPGHSGRVPNSQADITDKMGISCLYCMRPRQAAQHQTEEGGCKVILVHSSSRLDTVAFQLVKSNWCQGVCGTYRWYTYFQWDYLRMSLSLMSITSKCP